MLDLPSAHALQCAGWLPSAGGSARHRGSLAQAIYHTRWPIFSPSLPLGLLYLERVIAHVAVHSFLDGVTAGVVGLIAATTLILFQQGITSIPAALIFVLALVAVYRWKAKAAVAGIVLGAGLLSLLVSQL